HSYCTPLFILVHPFHLPLRPPPTSTLFPYTTLFRSYERRTDSPNLSFPASGLISFVRMRKSVVLPAPFGPMMPTMPPGDHALSQDRKSTRLNSSHVSISYAVFCLKKKKINAKRL